MKKAMFVFTAFLILAKATHANPETKIPVAIQASFEHLFSKKIAIDWEKVGEIFIGTFQWNNESRKVYYNENGEMIAEGRFIMSHDLPAFLREKISKDYAGYTVTEAFELNTNGEMQYFFSLDSAKTSIVASSDGFSIHVEQQHKN